MAFADVVPVPEAFLEVTVHSNDVQSTHLGRRQKTSYRNNGTVASPGRLPIYTAELLSHLDHGEAAWVPDLQSSDESADEGPIKPTLKQLPKGRSWWDQYQNPLTYSGSDSANSDGEEEPEEEKPRRGGHRLTILHRNLCGSSRVSGPQSVKPREAWTNGTTLKKLPPSQLGKPKAEGGRASKSTVQGRTAGEDHQVSCPDCGQSFKSKISLGNHKRVHSEVKPYKCPSCPERFTSKRLLGTHQRDHAGEVGSSRHRRPQSPKLFECSACKKRFKLKKHLLWHQKSHPTEQQPHRCPECGKAFPQKALLLRHRQSHLAPKAKGLKRKGEEKAGGLPEASEKKASPTGAESSGAGFPRRQEDQINLHKCRFCGKCLRFRSLLVDHERIHREQRPCGEEEPEEEKPHRGGHQLTILHRNLCGSSRVSGPQSVKPREAWTNGTTLKKLPPSQLGKPKAEGGRASKSTVQGRTAGEDHQVSCPDCGQSFKSKISLGNHKRVHSEVKPYKCPSCPERFTSKRLLGTHQRDHAGEVGSSRHRRPQSPKLFECSACKKRFKLKKHLLQHQKSHPTEQQPHRCPECGKAFPQKALLLRHRQSHLAPKAKGLKRKGEEKAGGLPEASEKKASPTGAESSGAGFPRRQEDQINLHKCRFCGKCLRFRSLLVDHERIHREEKPYKCSQCNKSFLLKSVLLSHMKIHMRQAGGKHPKEVESLAVEDASDGLGLFHSSGNFPKGLVSRRTTTRSFHRTHPKRIQRRRTHYKCQYCGKSFITNSNLADHEKLHIMDRPYTCHVCAESFTRKHHLIRHQKTHTGGKSIKYVQGLKIKSSEGILNRPKACEGMPHARTITSNSFLAGHPEISIQGNYMCQDCGKCMRTKSSFVNHGKIHQRKQQPYSYLEGEKSFTQRNHLRKDHLLGSGSDDNVPTKQPPFSFRLRIPHRKLPASCQICGKTFRDHCAVTRHESTHSGKKPFKCDACGKSFIQVWHLNRHKSIHLKQKYPKAEVNHENSPIGKKPFGCVVCGKGFCRSWYLKRHERIHQSEERHILSAVSDVNSVVSNSRNGTNSEKKSSQGRPLVQAELQAPSRRIEVNILWDDQESKINPLAVLEKGSGKCFRQKEEDVNMQVLPSKKSKRHVLQGLQESRQAVKLDRELRMTDKGSVHQPRNCMKNINFQCHKKGRNPAGWQLRSQTTSRRNSKREMQLTGKRAKQCFCQQEEPITVLRKKPNPVGT